MYTKQWNGFECCWDILDPKKEVIAYINSRSQADTLLSHLNRGQ